MKNKKVQKTEKKKGKEEHFSTLVETGDN